MANRRYLIGTGALSQATTTPGECFYWIADTDAGKPVTGLNVGDLITVVDKLQLEIADSATTSKRIPRTRFAQTASTSVTNTTTETTLIGSGVGDAALPDSFFSSGQILGVRGGGRLSTGLITGRSLSLKLYKGSTALASMVSLAIPAATSDSDWYIDVMVMGRSSTTVSVTGWFNARWPSATMIGMQNFSGGGDPVTISSSAESLSLKAQWASGVTADDLISVRNLVIEQS